MKQMRTAAKTEILQDVLDFIEEQLDSLDCPMKARIQLNIAVEEIFVNIASYAYPETEGDVTIQFMAEGNPVTVTIVFTDTGIPYNPLAKADPDITLSAEERQIGGLGIFIVKESMDDVAYERCGNQNILTIQKIMTSPKKR